MSTFTDQTKNTTSFADATKHTATFNNATKHASSYNDQAKNATTYTDQSRVGIVQYLLLETGDFILQESGFKIILEQLSNPATTYTDQIKH